MTVDRDISDLFFNHDVSDAKEFVGDVFDGYSDSVMINEATLFLASLGRLGVRDLPTSADLVADFYDRI